MRFAQVTPPPPPGSSLAWLGSEKVISLLTRTETALETLVYSPLNRLTRLLAREYFIEFRCSDTFKLNINVLKLSSCDLNTFTDAITTRLHRVTFISASYTQLYFHV